MNAVEIEEAISALADQPFDAQEFPFAFLEAFGDKPTTIKKLRAGATNRSDVGGVLKTGSIHIAISQPGEVSKTLAALRASPATSKARVKYILATDGEHFEAEELQSVDIDGAHVLPLFRRDGAPSATVAIRWVKGEGSNLRWITEPSEGVMITPADVLVRRGEVERFEAQHELFNGARSASAGDDSRPAARRGGPGVPPRYDWDGFYGALARRIHDHGIPPTQAELVREMLDWFGQRDGGEAPDESTVRRKIVAIWRELSRAHG